MDIFCSHPVRVSGVVSEERIFLTLENGNDKLPQNISKKLPVLTA